MMKKLTRSASASSFADNLVASLAAPKTDLTALIPTSAGTATITSSIAIFNLASAVESSGLLFK